jgi:hypothetical protein
MPLGEQLPRLCSEGRSGAAGEAARTKGRSAVEKADIAALLALGAAFFIAIGALASVVRDVDGGDRRTTAALARGEAAMVGAVESVHQGAG